MGTFATSGACIFKAGVGMNDIFKKASGAAIIEQYLRQAEAKINVMTRRDWSGAFVDISGDVVKILEDTASDLAGMKMINYDMQGYGTQAKAETMLDVLRDNSFTNLSILRDLKQQDFIDGA